MSQTLAARPPVIPAGGGAEDDGYEVWTVQPGSAAHVRFWGRFSSIRAAWVAARVAEEVSGGEPHVTAVGGPDVPGAGAEFGEPGEREPRRGNG